MVHWAVTAPWRGVTLAPSAAADSVPAWASANAVIQRAAACVDLRLDLQGDRAEVLDALVLQDLGVDGLVSGLEGTGAVDGVTADAAGGVAVELVPTERGLAGERERHVSTVHLGGCLGHVAVEAGTGRGGLQQHLGGGRAVHAEPLYRDEVVADPPLSIVALADVPAVGARCTAWQTPHLAVDCE